MFDDKSVTFHGTPCSRFAGCAISKVFSKRKLEFESTGFSAGRIVKKSVQAVPNYMINDYLSSVRVVTDHTGNVLERNDYYGFGSRIDCVSEGDNRYRFSGKESLSGFGIDYMDFGARLYDPVICRWLSQDPLAFSTPSVSPYSYCAGDPVNFVDPDGNNWYSYYDDDGNVQYKYIEGQMSKSEMKSGGYTDMGYSFVSEDNKYYSLFGYILDYTPAYYLAHSLTGYFIVASPKSGKSFDSFQIYFDKKSDSRFFLDSCNNLFGTKF